MCRFHRDGGLHGTRYKWLQLLVTAAFSSLAILSGLPATPWSGKRLCVSAAELSSAYKRQDALVSSAITQFGLVSRNIETIIINIER
jgi:hypothetical protein